MPHALSEIEETVRGRSKLLPEVTPAARSLVLDLVDLSELVVDADYQRRISDRGLSRIAQIVAGFDWSRFGALILSRAADGRLSVIDGQHRMIAARALRIDCVPAVIVDGDQRKQAQDFVAVNSVRTSVASIDKFRARVVSGDAAAVEVSRMLGELGISTDIAAGAAIRVRETRAVSTLEKLVKRTAQGIVFTTLETMLDAQPEVPNLLTAFNIEATATVVQKMLAADRDLERLDAVLRDTDFETLKEEAAQLVKLTGGNTAARGAELLLKRVNKGLKEKVA